MAVGSRWRRMNEHAARVVLVWVGSLVIIAESLVQLLDPLLDFVLPDALVVDWRFRGALVQLVLVKAVFLMLPGVFKLLFDRIDELLIFFFSGKHVFVGLAAPSFFLLVSFPHGLPTLGHDALRRGRSLFWCTFITTRGFAFTACASRYRALHLLPATSLEHLQLSLHLQVLLPQLVVLIVVSRNIQIRLRWTSNCAEWVL